MAAAGNIQIMYGCENCKEASDSHGRGCKCGLMFPVLLLLSGMTSCPNYEEDIEKINKSMGNRQVAEN